MKRRAILDYHRSNADFLVCQETHSTPEVEQIWKNEWGGEIIFAHGTSAKRGVAVFYKKALKPQVHNICVDLEGRYIVFDLEHDGTFVTIAAIYAPNQDKPDFFTEIANKLRTRYDKKVIIGDFNLTLDVDIDRLNTYSNNTKARDEVVNIMEEFSMKDVWRMQNIERREYSWWKGGDITSFKASRIDLALCTAGIDQQVKAIQYLTSVQTDHRAIYMVIDLATWERGRGYWKLNTSLLQRADYVTVINTTIEEFLQSAIDTNPKLRWEQLKSRVKKTSIDFARRSSSEQKLIIAQLSEKVNEYEANLPLSREEDILWRESKAELENQQLDRIKGVMFRSKAKWYELGEKGTRYFYSLEKARYNTKTCFKMLVEDREVTNPQDILQAQREFYKDLCSVEENIKFDMKNSGDVKVPEDIALQQQEQITIQELGQAIKTMNNNKTPGEDGLPVDFYKVFWPKIKNLFYEMMIACHKDEILHDSARKGILNLIPKANKDPRLIKNLRPITLLNTDYKIIEKAVANKMLPALEKIINPDQRGFMRGRRISVNIRKFLDLMYHVEKEDLEAVVLSLDFVKCFDKCSFQILHGSLDYFEFGSIVKEWTKILYEQFSVKVQNNGYFSDPFPIEKGVHQGGCCSSVYFLVIAEILAIMLRNNEEIQGITVRDFRHLLNQFADDMDVSSLASEKSISQILEELDKFKYQSGFTVSYEKTTLYRIGSLRHSNATMYNMDQYKWSNKDITVLGVTISHEDIVRKNYSGLVDKAKSTLNSWYNRGLSLIGKVQVVNTLVASLFVYKMMVLERIPQVVIKKVDNLIRDFLWNGKKAKIAYKILQNPKNQGGLNLCNLEKKDIALKATWPTILASEKDYSGLVYTNMRMRILQEDIWRCSLLPEHVEKMRAMCPFWRDVLYCWSTYNFLHGRRVENQLIWYNSNILIGDKPFFWADIYRRGLKYVYQLFEEGAYKSEQKVREEFSLEVLRYNSLKQAIPKEWKIYFCSTPFIVYSPVPPHNYDTEVYGQRFGLSRRIYKFIAEDITLLHYKYIKWGQARTYVVIYGNMAIYTRISIE